MDEQQNEQQNEPESNETLRAPIDRKERRITLRLTGQDLARIHAEAVRESLTVAAVVRRLIRAHLPLPTKP